MSLLVMLTQKKSQPPQPAAPAVSSTPGVMPVSNPAVQDVQDSLASAKKTAVKLPRRKSGMQKQIPTLIGVGVLLVSLVAGLLMFGQGTGVFAPRASAEETPKSVKTTNVTDKAFTISFYTDAATYAYCGNTSMVNQKSRRILT